ncbi:MAG: DUF401 family protein [Thermoplasmatales archaeon]|nr:MAG: DUF401 family protein [Thermoplasmatales archaeon]
MLNLIGVIIAFITMIILIRKKFNFGLSIIIGAIIIGFFSLQTIDLIDIPKAIIEASIYSFETQQIYTETLELAILMTLIFALAKSMQETGAITKLIDSLRTFFSKGGTLGVIPAVYGLMPVPGGALFSVPLIDKEGDKFGLNKNQKNYLNVWFRHIWFPIYPISAAMILLCSEKFANINIYNLVVLNIPAFILMIIIGMIVLKKVIKKAPSTTKQKKNFQGLVYLIPPLVPILVYALLQFFDIPRTRSFIIGVFLGLLLLYLMVKLTSKEYTKILKKSLTWKFALAIFGIIIFRQMIEVSGATAIIVEGINSIAIPSILLIILIPLFLGTVTGYNLGAIALSYPIIASLQGDLGAVSFASIIFMSSLAGYLISPIHLCNVVSSEYLKTDTTRMYRFYIPSIIMLLLIHSIIVIVMI